MVPSPVVANKRAVAEPHQTLTMLYLPLVRLRVRRHRWWFDRWRIAWADSVRSWPIVGAGQGWSSCRFCTVIAGSPGGAILAFMLHLRCICLRRDNRRKVAALESPSCLHQEAA